jgi:hypothetical protein
LKKEEENMKEKKRRRRKTAEEEARTEFDEKRRLFCDQRWTDEDET